MFLILSSAVSFAKEGVLVCKGSYSNDKQHNENISFKKKITHEYPQAVFLSANGKALTQNGKFELLGVVQTSFTDFSKYVIVAKVTEIETGVTSESGNYDTETSVIRTKKDPANPSKITEWVSLQCDVE